MQVDSAQSQRVAAIVLADSVDVWSAAFQALSHLPQSSYVEGWAVDLESFSLFEHAWLVVRNQIIDPTHWEADLTYFAGLHFSAAKAQAVSLERGYFPLAHRSPNEKRNQPMSSDAPAYWSAWEEANKLVDGQKRAHLWRSWRRWLDLLNERRSR